MNSQTFDGLGLSSRILGAVSGQGYSTPTDIQRKAIPPMLRGNDLLATARTGTGKTAAFLLPLLDRIERKAIRGDGRKGPIALVLAPTRELAAQIAESAVAYGRGTGIGHAVVFGGVSKAGQITQLRRRPQILIATPGRLLDLVGEGHIRLDAVSVLILDEGDRMLDMGFIPAVRKIASMVATTRQTALFSATMPPTIEELAHDLLDDPVRVTGEQTDVAIDRIEQEVLHLPQAQKTALLPILIRDRGMFKVIVFTRTKHKASRLAKQLDRQGLPSDSIHGDKSQNARRRALDSFHAGKIQVLVATDVASRGIDVDDITHVVNYDLPNEPESYVHRIGRTARAGASGSAISMCDPGEIPYLRAIETLQKVRIPVTRDHEFHLEPPPEAPRQPASPRRRRSNNGGRSTHRGGQGSGAVHTDGRRSGDPHREGSGRAGSRHGGRSRRRRAPAR